MTVIVQYEDLKQMIQAMAILDAAKAVLGKETYCEETLRHILGVTLEEKNA